MSNNNRNNGEKTVIVVTEKVEINQGKSHQEPCLIQLSGRETGQMYRLTGKTIKIGRDASCEIMFDDPHISRVHAEISCSPGAAPIIKDLGSTNGIFVNGRKVQESKLAEGDKVLVGTRLYFKFSFQDALEQNYQQSLFQAANLDPLTQLYNRKYFTDALTKEFSFSRRTGQPLSLMMVDIDHFKKVNDTYGHPGGDFVLKNLASYFQKNIRLENVCCRYGGEEMAVILRNANGPTALSVAERLRQSIASEDFNFQNQTIKVTISIGIATLEGTNFDTAEDLVSKADEHLYEAKESGRNRTIMKQAA